MTQPKITTVKKGGSRFYVHPKSDVKAVGVTSVLNMLPKEFLKFWAAKLVAETAVDNAGSWIGIALGGDRQGAIDYLKKAPMRNTGAAANRGTGAHDLFERLAGGEKLGRRDIHPDMTLFVDHFRNWMELAQPDFMHLEATVWSDKYGYAGSFDALATFTDEDGEKRNVMLDWKTTRSGVHAEVALQLNAYANADYIINADGTTTDLPEIHGAAVLWVVPEEWQFVPVRLDPEFMEVFSALQTVLKWEKELKDSALGKPIFQG